MTAASASRPPPLNLDRRIADAWRRAQQLQRTEQKQQQQQQQPPRRTPRRTLATVAPPPPAPPPTAESPSPQQQLSPIVAAAPSEQQRFPRQTATAPEPLQPPSSQLQPPSPGPLSLDRTRDVRDFFAESDIHDDVTVTLRCAEQALLAALGSPTRTVKRGETVQQLKRGLVADALAALPGLCYGDIDLALDGRSMLDPLSLNDFPALAEKQQRGAVLDVVLRRPISDVNGGGDANDDGKEDDEDDDESTAVHLELDEAEPQPAEASPPTPAPQTTPPSTAAAAEEESGDEVAEMLERARRIHCEERERMARENMRLREELAECRRAMASKADVEALRRDLAAAEARAAAAEQARARLQAKLASLQQILVAEEEDDG